MNSISIMPNSEHLRESIPLLGDGLKKSIHINLAEGRCCSISDEIPLLQKNGIFNRSFLSLALLSVFRAKEVERESAIEIGNQIEKVASLLSDEYRIRIDSHVHFHMIPAIFRGMCTALEKSGHHVEYVRFPDEILSLYLKTPQVWKYIKFTNILKTCLLKIYGIINLRTLKRHGHEKKTGLFFGLVFSGEMEERRIRPILDRYKKHARDKNLPLEVLFHPGGIMQGEDFLKGSRKGYINFYRSPNRIKESKTLKALRSEEAVKTR